MWSYKEMKVRIGISLGPNGTPDTFATAVDLLEQARVDSLWLPETVYGSLLTPAEAGSAVAVIKEAAATAGREVEEDHFGLSLAIAFGAIPATLATAVGRRRPGVDPATLVAAGWDGARRMISQYVAAGLSKFVVRPATPMAFEEFVAGFVQELMPLQAS